MRRYIYRIGIVLAVMSGLLLISFFALARKEIPQQITYGISFNVPYVQELGLDPDTVFDAFLHDLGVRHLRLAAHWPLIEPQKDVYDFSWMDRHLAAVEGVGGEVIFGVGRRLPRWPECHVPGWAEDMSWEDQKQEILQYMELTVRRYKDSPVIRYWQIENEPYLEVFAKDHCGEFDENFLEDEIALVRSIDPTRKILVTDSGNLGTWAGAYQNGDVFGTSVYVYFWNPDIGQFKTVLPPWAYRVKENMLRLWYGDKETLLIELSAEPWLLEPITKVPVEIQYQRMDAVKLNEILEYAQKTRYDMQYLWGGEWWYWLREKGHSEMWERGKEIFKQNQV